MSEAPDCRTCGACCGPSEDVEGYVSLDPADLRRLTRSFRRLHVLQPHRGAPEIRMKRGTSGVVCAALRGSVGGRVSCSIYERRPHACRAMRPGSRDCIETRRLVLDV